MLTFIIKPENYKKMFSQSNFVIDVHIRFILYGKKLPFSREREGCAVEDKLIRFCVDVWGIFNVRKENEAFWGSG